MRRGGQSNRVLKSARRLRFKKNFILVTYTIKEIIESQRREEEDEYVI